MKISWENKFNKIKNLEHLELIKKMIYKSKENKVDFLIIGATAFPVYGYSRATLDIDIFIRAEKENAKKTLISLKTFGYDISDITAEELLTNKILIRQDIVETDIRPFVAGVEFEEVWKNKIKNKIGDIEVYFPSLDDMIKMKKAAGRKKDIEDLKILEKIRKK